MKRILFTLIMVTGLFLGTYISVIEIQAQLIEQPTYTPNPTLTPRPTYTDLPTYTPNPTFTPCPPTPYPTSTSYPTATDYFTSTPYPTSTSYPDQHCSVPPNAYYVSPTGNDSNPGTLNQPWRTIQKAADSMTEGDTVIILTGEYDERVQINTSGVDGTPITYRAEGTVTMKGFTIKADYVVIQGFEITDTDNDWKEGWGIFLEGSHCTLEDNYIYFATRGGIILSANEGDDPITSNSVVRNNRVYRNAHTGINVQGRNNLVENNEVWGTIQHHPQWTPLPSYADADGIRFFGRGHTIRGNYIHDISYDDPENVNPHIDCFQTWPKVTNTQDIIFEQNVCEALTSQVPNESGHGFMLAGASNIIIRNNIIRAYGGINTGGGGNSNLTIVNNIFANDLLFQEFFPGGVGLDDCPNTIVMNNIFFDQPYHTISVGGNRSGQEIDYNLAYRSDGQPSECYQINYQCVSPAPVHHYWDIDPMFVDPANGDYHLQFGSPAIDAGVDVGLPYYGPAPDIGAFEFIQ